MQGLRHAKQFFGHFKLVALAYMETYQIGCYAIIQMENLRLFKLPIDAKAETCKTIFAETIETIFWKNLRHAKHLVLLRQFKIHQHKVLEVLETMRHNKQSAY